MIGNWLKNKIVVGILSIGMVILSSANAFAYAESDKEIKNTSEFGTITSKSDTFLGGGNEKLVCLSVETTRKVADKYVIKYNIVYSDTGESITGAVTLTNCNVYYNSPMRSHEDVEMHHWYNKRTGKRDGFVSTKITAFSTHEVRGNNAYASYLVTSK